MPIELVFDPEQAPPSTHQIAQWQQEILQELQLYQLILQSRLWYGVAAILFVGWYLYLQPESLGLTLTGLGLCGFVSLLLFLIFQAIIGSRPQILQRKIYSLQPIDDQTQESLQGYRVSHPGIDHYLSQTGDRPIVWAEYWMISLHVSDQSDENDIDGIVES